MQTGDFNLQVGAGGPKKLAGPGISLATRRRKSANDVEKKMKAGYYNSEAKQGTSILRTNLSFVILTKTETNWNL